jgi:hypothetical protein
MRAIRVYRRLESETLSLPELKDLIGKDVEIVVLEDVRNTSPEPTEEPDYSALAGIAGQNLIDPEAYKEGRAASMI